MFKKVISTPGFWKSVFSLSFAFALLFLVVKWAIEGFSFAFITERNPLLFFILLVGASIIYGFFVTFGKFKSKIKGQQSKK